MEKPKLAIKLMSHPHYGLMLEIANKISRDYGIETRVDSIIRSHYFMNGVNDLCIRLPYDCSTSSVGIGFMAPLSGLPPIEKETKYGIFSDNNVRQLMHQPPGYSRPVYMNDITIEELMAVEGNLKKIEFKDAQGAYGAKRFSTCFHMNDGKFEAPIEQGLRIAY